MVQYNNGPASSSDANFFGPRRANMPAYRPSDYVIRLMDGTSFYAGVKDPRMAYLFKPSDDGVFRGITMNLGESTTLPANRKTYNFFGLATNAAPVGGPDANSRSFFKNNAKFPYHDFG
jgi:hypothetical protein